MSPKTDVKHDPYRMPNYPCATCGKSSSQRRKEWKAGFGDWHLECRRENGHLIIWDELLKRERPL